MQHAFTLTSSYDKTAYQALAEASWQLFRKPQMSTQAYPVLVILSVMILILSLSHRESHPISLTVGGILFSAFVLLAIPLSGVSARRKMCRTAIREADKKGEYPVDIQFEFGKDTIRSVIGGDQEKAAVVRYSQIDLFAALGDWRFLFFGPAAYIFHKSSFSSQEELAQFESCLEAHHLPKTQLKGTGPVRETRD